MTLFTLNSISKDTLMETLAIEFIEIGDDFIVAKMPVNEKVFQPYKYLHGGATLALIETVGSAVSLLQVDFEKYDVIGTNINAHHIKSTRGGEVTAKAKIIKSGKLMHLIQIEVRDTEGSLMSYATQTNVIKEKSKVNDEE